MAPQSPLIAPMRLHRVLFAILVAGAIVWHGLGAAVMETGLHGIDGVAHWQENLDLLCDERPELCEE